MKTRTNTLHKILTAGACFSIITLVNLSIAQPQKLYSADQPASETEILATTGSDKTKVVESNKAGRNIEIIEMLDNKTYWVDHLKAKSAEVDMEEDLSTLNDQNSTVKEMESEKYYWTNYLNKIENENTDSEIGKMQNDKKYWIEYLNSIISTPDPENM